MPDQLKDIIARIGKTHKKLTSAILALPDEGFYELAVDLAIAARPEISESKPFSFIANSSLSGGPHPCASYACRVKKLEELACFAAFYADTVYIQDPFEKIVLHENEEITEVDRENLLFGIEIYMYLYPLFQRGLIKFGQSSVCLCDHHKKEIVDKLYEKRICKEERIYAAIKQTMIEHCRFEVDTEDDGEIFLKLSGPDELVEHGQMFLHFNFIIPAELQNFVKSQKLPYQMASEEVMESKVIESWIKPVIDDLFFQEWHSTFYGTKLLTDNEAQIDIASSASDPEKYTSSKALRIALRHNLPTIFSKSVSDILFLRDAESEAFYVYRDKLNKIIKESYKWNSKEISQMFEDVVLPEINQINNKVRNWKTNLRDSAKSKLIFGAGTVAVGLFSGILPPDIGRILAAIGGYSGMTSLLETFNKSYKGDEEAKKNDMYFLWKAQK